MSVEQANPRRGAATDSRPAADSSARLHGLDALRAAALGLGIVLHSLMSFLPGGGWLIQDSQSSQTAAVTVNVIHLFRMVLFMMLAGYFGRMVLHRRGPASYLKDRALRILLPMLAFAPIMLVSIVAVIAFDNASRGTEAPTPAETAPPLWLQLTNPSHLWFLNVLMQCVVITVVARAVLVRLVGSQRLTFWAQRAGLALALPGGVVIAAVPYLAAQLMQGKPSGGIEQPVTILPDASALVGFLGAFLVGWCLHARADALARITRTFPYHLGAAVVATVAGHFIDPDAVPLPVYAAIVAISGWSWTLGLLGLCVRFLNRESPTVRYLADSSYWAYIWHLPLLVAVQVFLADLSWPIIVKLLIAWLVTGALLLLSYDIAARGTWLGRWLNGRRRNPVLLRRSRRADS